MKQYRVPVFWEMYGSLIVEANSEEEALAVAEKEAETCALPEGNYVDESFKIDYDAGVELL